MGAADEVGVCFHLKMKTEHRFSLFIKKKKMKIERRFLFSFFAIFLKKMKIKHRFSFFIFLCSEKK